MKDKLNILTHSYYPGSTADAVRIMSFTRMLQDTHDIKVVVSGQGKAILNEQVLGLGKKTNFTSNRWIRLLREIRLSFSFIHQLRGIPKSELLLISSPPYMTFLMVRMYCQFTGRKYIHDLRDPYPEIMTSSKTLQALIDTIERRLLRSTQFIWVTTETWQQRMQEKLKFDKVVLIPNGHSFTNERKQTVQMNTKLTVGVLGNIGEFQDIDLMATLVERCAEESAIEFKIYGSGSKLRALSDRIAHLPNCELKGRVPHDEVEAILNSFDLGLSFRKVTSINEYIVPVRTFEFIGMGVPIIILPCTQFSKELANKGLAYCFERKQLDEIVLKIKSFVADRSELVAMSEKQWQQRGTYDRSLIRDRLLTHISGE